MVNIEDIVIPIVVSILTTLVTLAMPSFLRSLRSRMRGFKWQSNIPKDYPNRDIMISLRPHSKIKVLEEEYEVTGLVMITSGGEKWFGFTLKTENLERWLEFSEDRIMLWGDWADEELWKDFRSRREWPSPMVIRRFESLKDPFLEVGGVKVKPIDMAFQCEAETLWGRWSGDSPFFEKIDYKHVDAVIVSDEGDEIHIDDRKMYVSLEAFGGQAIFNEFEVGFELSSEDIRSA